MSPLVSACFSCPLCLAFCLRGDVALAILGNDTADALALLAYLVERDREPAAPIPVSTLGLLDQCRSDQGAGDRGEAPGL